MRGRRCLNVTRRCLALNPTEKWMETGGDGSVGEGRGGVSGLYFWVEGEGMTGYLGLAREERK